VAISANPSPSKSLKAIAAGSDVTVMRDSPNEPEVKSLPPPWNTVMNGFADQAVSPAFVMEIGSYVAPPGATTESVVAVAAVTVAFAAPKYTMLFAGVGLKPMPLMVTGIPVGPEVGENELMVGCAKRCCANKKRTKRITGLDIVLCFAAGQGQNWVISLSLGYLAGQK
jgi:hypothetical protein